MSNYLPLIDWAAMQGLEPGSVNIVEIAHDDWCKAFKGLPCNCNPIGFFPHHSGLHEVAIVNGEPKLVSIDGKPIGTEQ